MARVLDRERALQLRKQEKSYSQIKQILHVSKSTLSVWLRDYPLTTEQINSLRAKSPRRIERFRETMRRKREARLKEIYEHEKERLLILNMKELMVAGLFLYWGEGSKTQNNTISLNNTDPKVVQFFYYWLREVMQVPKDKIKVSLHLYRDMNVENELSYWSNLLQISLSQFVKPYIKSSNRENLTHKGFGHGTCGLMVHNTSLREHVMMGIAAISDYYSSKN